MSDSSDQNSSSEQPSRVPERVSPPPPPHPLDTRYYTHFDGQTFGPYSGHEIKQYAEEGRLSATSQVMRVGTDTWRLAGEEPLLAAIFKKPTNVPPPLTNTSSVSAAAGATIVQVTNNIPQQRPFIDLGDVVAGPKSPAVAMVLSFLLAGAGQMYNGEVGKGILMLLFCILLWGIFLGWIITIWSMIDAYNVAKKINVQYQYQLRAQSPVG